MYTDSGGFMLKKLIDKRNYIILFIIIVLIIVILGTKDRMKEYIKSFDYFDETITMKIYTDQNMKPIIKNINSIYKKYDDYYNNYYKDKGFQELLRYGNYVYKETDGLVDISAGKTVDSVKKGQALVFESDIENPDLENMNLSVIIDVYATNRVINYLISTGIDKYIINTDGVISTGEGINNEKYSIALFDQNGKFFDIAYLENTNLVTKGAADEFKAYMVNVKTGEKISDKFVIVIDDDLNEANYIADTLYVMSVKEGKEFIKRYDAEAYWKVGNKISTTKGFKKYLKSS